MNNGAKEFTPEQIRDSLEAAVVTAYDEARDELHEFEEAPELCTVHDIFVANTHDNILELYEEFFGEGVTPRKDWMYEIGLDIQGIPDILTICRILNMFKLAYYYRNTLYNHVTHRLLREPEKIEEDLPW